MKKLQLPLFQIRSILLAFIFVLPASEISAQIAINSFSAYSQNFNSLPQSSSASWTDNSTLPGWYAASNLAVNSVAASNGSDNSVGLKSYGHTSTPTDRSLGCVTCLLAGGSGTGSFYYGVRFVNNTGSLIKSFTVTYAMEVWLDAQKQDPVLKFHYSKGPSVTSLTSGTWTNASDLYSTVIVQGNRGTVDGNASNCRIVKTVSLNNVNLEAGDEIMLRWTDEHDNKNNYVALDDVVITPATGNSYFNKNNGSATQLSSWGVVSDGSGTAPSSFSDSDQHFVFKNNSYYTIPANWTIAGSNSKLVVGDNSSAITFTIPANYTFSGEIDVTNNSKLAINNATIPNLGALGTQSTIEYNTVSNQVLAEADYGILSIGTGTKILGANTRIKGSLIFNSAKLELDNYDLILDEGATISGASTTSYISTKGTGRVKRPVKADATGVEFPVGTDTYQPVTISLAPGSTDDEFSVKAMDGVYDYYSNNVPAGQLYGSKALGTTWIIDEEIAGGSDITLRVEWAAINALANFDPSNARIVHFTNGSWDESQPLNANLSSGRYSVTRSGITSFSPFGVFSGAPNLLPVELLSFEVFRSENGTTCNWKTATEKDNHFFAIERSLNGRAFEEIGQVKGAGNSSQLQAYRFTDVSAPSAITYYRLRQVDLDGTFAYSQVVSVAGINRNENNISVYPNPAKALRFLQSRHQLSGLVDFTLRDIQGRIIKQFQVKGETLQAGVPLDLSQQPQGIYMLEVNTGKDINNLRLINQ